MRSSSASFVHSSLPAMEDFFRRSSSASTGPSFVPATEEISKENLRDSEPSEYEGKLPVLYRVMRIHDDGDLIVLQATFRQNLRKQQRDLEFILLDSRAVCVSPSVKSPVPVNLRDVKQNDLIYIYDLEIPTERSKAYDFVERNGITTVAHPAAWFAKTVFFLERIDTPDFEYEQCSDTLFNVLTKLAKKPGEAPVASRQQMQTRQAPRVAKEARQAETLPKEAKPVPTVSKETKQVPTVPKEAKEVPSISKEPKRVPTVSPPRTQPVADVNIPSMPASDENAARSVFSYQRVPAASQQSTQPAAEVNIPASDENAAPSVFSYQRAAAVSQQRTQPAADVDVPSVPASNENAAPSVFSYQTKRVPRPVDQEETVRSRGGDSNAVPPTSSRAQEQPTLPQEPVDFLNRDIFESDEEDLDEETGDDGDHLQPEMRERTKRDVIRKLREVSRDQMNTTTMDIIKGRVRRREATPRNPLSRNYRRILPPKKTKGFAYPIAYRVIAVDGPSNQLVLESLFFEHFSIEGEGDVFERQHIILDVESLEAPKFNVKGFNIYDSAVNDISLFFEHFSIEGEGDVFERQHIILDAESLEAPKFNVKGFNIYDSAVNDIVCIYDLLPYEGEQPEPDTELFERSCYNGSGSKTISYKSFAHCFLKISLFKTLYGLNNNEKTIITGIDEPVDIDNNRQICRSIGDTVDPGDMFRIDVMPYNLFTQISSPANLRAGSDLKYATDKGPRKMLILAGKKLSNIMDTYTEPFEHNLHIIEALDRQAAALALGKYGEQMYARIELIERGYPVRLNFSDECYGTIDFIERTGGATPDEKLKNETELKIFVPLVGSFVIHIVERCVFAVASFYKRFVAKNKKHIEQNADKLVATPVDTSPNDDRAIRFLCNGGFARSMKRQAQLPKDETNCQLVLDSLRTKEFSKMYGELKKLHNIHIDPKVVFPDETLTLDKEQQTCVKAAACCAEWPAIMVVHACAGAGKSLTSVGIMKETVKRKPDSLQLVCSAANRAVDNLAESLWRLQDQIRIVRIYSDTQRAKMNYREPDYGFNQVVKKLAHEGDDFEVNKTESDILRDYYTSYTKLGDLASRCRSSEDFDTVENLRRRMKTLLPTVCDTIIRRYKPQVVLTTIDFFLSNCLSQKGNTLCRQTFDRVIIDEASQLEEARFVLLLNRNFNTRQFVIVGDSKQLPPHYPSTYDQRLKDLFGKPTLQLLCADTSFITKIPLLHVYRMHPTLMEMTSQAFYNGQLKSCDGPWKAKEACWTFLDSLNPLRMVLVNGTSEKKGTSQMNPKEADHAVELVLNALEDGVAPEDIGVICLYKSQMALILKKLKGRGVADVEVATVDSYQGREKDYIILLLTRTEYSSGDFFYSVNRSNVATSRAILGMVILCHESLMTRIEPWKTVYNFCQDRQLCLQV
uniref:ULP_PROTEASE domain-containing protein n=1 Tax=Steinernema glaseri TaxID=37863 RepID=A0A1I7ZV26_9BILA